MTELARQVLAYLQAHAVGAENRVSRPALRRALGRGDRAIRQAISELRELGYPIVGDPRRGGYYLAARREEAEVAIAILTSYASNILRQVHNLQRAFGLNGQQRLPLEV